MGMFDRIGDFFSHFDWQRRDSDTTVNPATGLPMIGGIGGIDAAGSPYGSDIHHHNTHADWSSPTHDAFSSSTSSWNQGSTSIGYDPFRGW